MQAYTTRRDRSTQNTDEYDIDANLYLQLLQSRVIKGHNLKVANTRCHHDLRKYSFIVRVMNIWNGLPE